MILFHCARFDQLIFGEYVDFSGSGDSGESSESIASLSILVNVAYSGESGALHKSGDVIFIIFCVWFLSGLFSKLIIPLCLFLCIVFFVSAFRLWAKLIDKCSGQMNLAWKLQIRPKPG